MSTPMLRLIDSATNNVLEIQVDAETLASTLSIMLQNKSGTIAMLDDIQSLSGAVDTQITDAVSAATQSLTDTFNQAISDLVGMAPAELDTLKEIADKFTLTDSEIESVLTALAGKVATSTFEALVTTVNAKLDGTHEGTGGNSHALATTSLAGFMSATDKSKLNGIAAGANNYTLPAATGTVLGGIKLSVSGSTLTITTT